MKLILLIIFCSSAYGQEAWIEVPVVAFGGLNTYNDSAKIDDGDAQDAQNVITDNGKLEKRPGNLRIASSGLSQDVRSIAEYISNSGTKYLIFQSSNTLYQTDLSGTPTAISTVNPSYDLDSTSIFGNFYYDNGQDGLKYWNGSSTFNVTGAGKCKFLVGENERIYCANTDASNIRVSVSSFGGAGYWTVPSVLTADSPSYFDFGKVDGTGITCFKSTPWGKFVGKNTSSYLLRGYDNNTYAIRPIDPSIGCQDNRSVQMVDGNLVWLGQDGIYAWNGAGAPAIISREIDSLVKSIRQLTSNQASWNVSSQVEFQLGNLTSGGSDHPISATQYAGSIAPSSWTVTDTSSGDFTNGTVDAQLTLTQNVGSVQFSSAMSRIYNGDFEAGVAAYPHIIHFTTATNGGLCVISTTSVSPISGTYSGVVTNSCGAGGDSIVDILDANNNVILAGTNGYGIAGGSLNLATVSSQTMKVRFRTFSGSNNCDLISTTFTAISSISWSAVSGNDCPAGADHGWAKIDDIKIDRFFPVELASATAIFTSQVFDTGFLSPFGGSLTSSATLPSNGTNISYMVHSATFPTGTFSTYVPISSNTARITANKEYYQYRSTFTTTIGTSTPRLSEVTLNAATTGQYDSAVHFIGTALTSWLAFNSTEFDTSAGSVTYYTRASSISFASSSDYPAWQAQTNNINNTAQTGIAGNDLYYQWRSVFNLYSGSSAIRIDAVDSKWQEGESKPVASFSYEQRYGLCGMVSTTTTKNDACLVYQRNHKWTKFNGPSYYSIGMFKKIPTAGSGDSNGYIWSILRPTIYNDDGAVISSSWTTKDYALTSTFNQKVLHEMWLDADYNTYESSVTVGYAANRSNTFTDKDVNLNSSKGYISTWLDLDSGSALGHLFRFKFSNNASATNFKINRFSSFLENQPLTHD